MQKIATNATNKFIFIFSVFDESKLKNETQNAPWNIITSSNATIAR
jgi:hypothetical protein